MDIAINLLAYLIIILLLLITTIYIYFKYSYTYWARCKIPFIPPKIPFGNSGQQLLQKITIGENNMCHYKLFKAQGLKFGGTFTLTKPVLIIVDPDLAKCVLSKDFAHFPDRGMYYDENHEPLSAHLLALSGVKWRNLRTKLTPTFTPSKMKMMFQILVKCSKHFEEVLEAHVSHERPIDMKDVTGRFTTDIIGTCAFGLDCNSLQNPEVEFRKYSKLIFEPTAIQAFKHFFSVLCPKLFAVLKLRKFSDEISNFFLSCVENIVTYREVNGVRRNDLMQLMINLKHTGDVDGLVKEPGMTLSDKEIAAQAFLFFLAGYETSSTTMTFFFYDMAMNRDIQDKIRDEIQEMLKKYEGELTYEGIFELEYLDKAIYESLRMHPPVPFLQRNCKQNYQIPNSNAIIEKDTLVVIPILGFQTDPEFFPAPDTFDPERFSAEEKYKRHPYTFLPFGEGPRNCIGLRFGLLQIKVGIIALLKNHRITLSPKTKTPITFDPKCFILTITGGTWITAERI